MEKIIGEKDSTTMIKTYRAVLRATVPGKEKCEDNDTVCRQGIDGREESESRDKTRLTDTTE